MRLVLRMLLTDFTATQSPADAGEAQDGAHTDWMALLELPG